MSKRQAWYGRPNPAPLNWHTPDRPVVRRVIHRSDNAPLDLPSLAKPDSIGISLTNEHWVTILKGLQLYNEAYGNKVWQHWRLEVRKKIIGVVNRSRDDTQSVEVNLPLSDWRMIWESLKPVCSERGGQWITWFKWLSNEMAQQINGSESDG